MKSNAKYSNNNTFFRSITPSVDQNCSFIRISSEKYWERQGGVAICCNNAILNVKPLIPCIMSMSWQRDQSV